MSKCETIKIFTEVSPFGGKDPCLDCPVNGKIDFMGFGQGLQGTYSGGAATIDQFFSGGSINLFADPTTIVAKINGTTLNCTWALTASTNSPAPPPSTGQLFKQETLTSTGCTPVAVPNNTVAFWELSWTDTTGEFSVYTSGYALCLSGALVPFNQAAYTSIKFGTGQIVCPTGPFVEFGTDACYDAINTVCASEGVLIAWGDGTFSASTSAVAYYPHTYPATGLYTINVGDNTANAVYPGVIPANVKHTYNVKAYCP